MSVNKGPDERAAKRSFVEKRIAPANAFRSATERSEALSAEMEQRSDVRNGCKAVLNIAQARDDAG